jgi:hypothetical protein
MQSHSLFLTTALVCACFAQPSVGQNSAATDPLQPRHWRVVWTADPATSASIAWDTYELGSQHWVTVRPFGTQASHTVPAAASGRYSYLKRQDRTFYYHHVALQDLQPGTTYEIRLHSDGRASRWFYFQTARSGDAPFSIAFGGDSRTGLEARKSVNRMLAKLVAASWSSPQEAAHIYALAHGGDYVFYGTDPPQWHDWLADYELTTSDDGRLLPIIPARGNHDRGRLFAEAFGFDPDDRNYYSLSFGSLLRFITLNTEISIAGDQAAWLRDELAAARPTHRWLVTQYHRPAYPAVKSPSGALAHWVPLFDQFHVDLACEADGHNIKRTMPIRGGTWDSRGVVYIGEGGLGVPQRTPKEKRWFLQPPGFAGRGHHVHVLTFTKDGLTIECRGLDGATVDTFRRTYEAAKAAENSP